MVTRDRRVMFILEDVRFLFMLSFAVLFGLYIVISKEQPFQKYHQPRIETAGNRSIRIHIYNKPGWLVKKIIEDSCEFKCHITTGKDSYNDSDVVVFHVPDFTERTVPPKKPKGQIWVLQSYESPAGRYTKFSRWRSLFNWTMTMRRDADIPFLIGTFMSKPKFIKEFTQKKFIKTTRPIKEYFATDPKTMADVTWQSKNKGISWFVSNCRTPSNRETYLRHLSKHIDVDIYGQCGNKSCPRNHKDCFDTLMRDYKMYASFENSLCRDYITEKSYKIYISLLNSIPIVRGGANYSLFLPPGSYINTGDFKNLESFVTRLRDVFENKQSSGEFFKWRRHYVPYYRRFQSFCELCRRMHQGPEKYRRLYDNVGNFINGNGYKPMCSEPNDIEFIF